MPARTLTQYFDRYLFLILLWALVFYTSAFAQESSDAEQNPLEVSVTYTGEFWANLSGGRETGTAYLDNIDINLEIDFGALPLGLEGTTVYIYGLGNQGNSISRLIGDVQGASNIESRNSWRFFEIWVQKKLFLAKSSILLGLYDINSEFNVLNSSLLFLNSSHGLDASLALSGVLGPSTFPYTSMGGRIKVNPIGGWVFKAAVLDGIPSNPENTEGTKIFWRERDGLLYLAELALYSVRGGQLERRNRTARLQRLLDRGAADPGGYKFAIGGWAYSKKRPGWRQNASEERDIGIYAMGEYHIYTEAEDPAQGLTIFGRTSLANDRINRLAGYLGGGLTYRGLIRGRPLDDIGISAAHAINSSVYRNVGPMFNGRTSEKAETNFEFTYLSVLTSSVSIQGDLQYIINPNMNPETPNALAAGVRLLLSF